MMTLNPVKQSTVQAVTCEVLPITGLAYLMDDENRTWPLTRQAAGPYFDQLQPGTSCQLTLAGRGNTQQPSPRPSGVMRYQRSTSTT